MKPLIIAVLLCTLSFAQQKNPPKEQVEKSSPAEKVTETPAERPTESPRREEPQPTSRTGEGGESHLPRNLKWDMTEVPPVVTHHQITAGGKVLRYTATTGRLPIKDQAGAIDAEVFFVAYTLDGQPANSRPLTFAFNGGPGSASIWLHMGALGPRKVVLQPDGFLPASPYRLEDNVNTPLDRTDLVLVDAIGTGFSRPADLERAKKFWGVKGDIEGFSEFIRLYITRNERWTSPLFILGESYGTTRAAGIAGYLSDHGIAFNGITLLSEVLNFETLRFAKTNDLPFILYLPSFTMVASYHKRLSPDLMQDLAKTRQEVEHWASTEYEHALDQGDALTPEQRQAVIDQLSRYTGLKKDFIDQANLRIDVRGFTHNLLSDQKLRVGRLDGRYSGPDPQGYLDTPFYDPTSSNTQPPFTAVFNDYVRRELGYKTDLPYYTSARDISSGSAESNPFKWEWGSANEGFPDTASALRAAMVKDPFLKVLVMEGYYDLATPYYAANYSMNHLDLPAAYRKNISFATYDCGHMVYLRTDMLAKMKQDLERFIDASMSRQ